MFARGFIHFLPVLVRILVVVVLTGPYTCSPGVAFLTISELLVIGSYFIICVTCFAYAWLYTKDHTLLHTSWATQDCAEHSIILLRQTHLATEPCLSPKISFMLGCLGLHLLLFGGQLQIWAWNSLQAVLRGSSSASMIKLGYPTFKVCTYSLWAFSLWGISLVPQSINFKSFHPRTPEIALLYCDIHKNFDSKIRKEKFNMLIWFWFMATPHDSQELLQLCAPSCACKIMPHLESKSGLQHTEHIFQVFELSPWS